MRGWAAAFIAICCTAAGAEPAIQFPGPVAEAVAPASQVKVTYFDPGENAFGGHDYSLRLVYPDGRSNDLLVFSRAVDVSWSPSGTALAVTNHITDDTADCYVFVPGTAGKTSLTEVVTQGRFPGPAWALQHSSRGSVRCDGWQGPDVLRFALDGVGEDNPRGFHYAFTYDLKAGRAKSAAAPSRKRKR